MLPTAADLTRLQDLSADFVAGKIDRDQGRTIFCDLVLERLRCSRVSLWRFEETATELSLLRFAFKENGGTLVTQQSRLTESEYQHYFDHLVGTGMYHSNDALADPVLAPMRDNYLLRDGVRAMLDAAFLVNGRAYGMVCCEQTDGVRRWRANEATLLRGLVSKLALLMAGAGDPDLWSSPSLPMQARTVSG